MFAGVVRITVARWQLKRETELFVVEEFGFHCHVEKVLNAARLFARETRRYCQLTVSLTIPRSIRAKSACKHTDYSAGFQTRLDYLMFAINLHRHRSLSSVCWDFICYCLLFLASTVFALSIHLRFRHVFYLRFRV